MRGAQRGRGRAQEAVRHKPELRVHRLWPDIPRVGLLPVPHILDGRLLNPWGPKP
jgi:hypothetical protein